MHQISKSIGAAILAAAAACAPQANDEYLGEPLLRMRGSVSTKALTTTQPIVPALCFFEEIAPSWLNLDIFPPEIQKAFENGRTGAPNVQLHVLDVQAHGQFPAEFKVDVYAPPPEAAIKPLFSGEPRAAWGRVCAVQADHKPIAKGIGHTSQFVCEHPVPEGACVFTTALRTEDGARYYYEQLDCPNFNAPPDQCERLGGGDETLLTETAGFEDVVAMAREAELVYLADPAPPGSATAYRLGAPDGLTAGYHLIKEASDEQYEGRQTPSIPPRLQAIAEINAQFGTSYTLHDIYGNADSPMSAPSEVIDTFERTLARIAMETHPIIVREELTPDDPGLTLELAPDPGFMRPLLPPGGVPAPQQ